MVRRLPRRLMTTPGGFFHLPNYGLGIRLKESLITTDLVKLRTEVQRQILLEPEFDSAQVAIALASNGVLTLTVKAILSTTQQQVVIILYSETQVGVNRLSTTVRRH